MVEAITEIIIQISAICFLCKMMIFVAGLEIVKHALDIDSFSGSDYVFSIAILPCFEVLKKWDSIFTPWFVNVKLNESHIRYEQSFISKFIDHLGYDDIDNVEIHYSPLGRLGFKLFGLEKYASITLISHGGHITLPFIKTPEKFIEENSMKIPALKKWI